MGDNFVFILNTNLGCEHKQGILASLRNYMKMNTQMPFMFLKSTLVYSDLQTTGTQCAYFGIWIFLMMEPLNIKLRLHCEVIM